MPSDFRRHARSQYSRESAILPSRSPLGTSVMNLAPSTGIAQSSARGGDTFV